jgi:predicted RNA-binding protein with RPS1 domain
MEGMVISNDSSKDIIKDYLEVSLDTKVKVLEVMDNDKIKFEVKECMKKL